MTDTQTGRQMHRQTHQKIKRQMDRQKANTIQTDGLISFQTKRQTID